MKAECGEVTGIKRRFSLEVHAEAEGITTDHIVEQILKDADPAGNVLHLALASCNRHDFLATWNCQHLANANKTDHIEHVNDLLGLPTPKLVTPMELLGVDGTD